MFDAMLNKDPSGNKMPLGQKLLKVAFTSVVSAVAGTMANNTFHAMDRTINVMKNPTVPPTE